MQKAARAPEEGGAGVPAFVRRLSIKWKLIGILLVLTLLGLTFVFAGVIVNNRIVFKRDLAHDMTVLADIIGSNSGAALVFDDAEAAGEILAALQANQRIVRAILYDAAGQRFAAYPRTPEANDPHPVLEHNETSAFRGDHFALIRDIQLDERRVGRLYLATDLKAWNESLRNYAFVFVFLALLTIALTFALAMLLQRVITAPLGYLAETAREVIRRKDYRIRAKKTTGDETGVLVDAFNEMLEEIQRRDAELLDAHVLLEQRVMERTAQLEAANKELEAFSYSVSHDLRAPLRAIDGFSQALLEDCAAELDAEGKNYLERVRDAAQRMGYLIDDLLKLARVTRAEIVREDADLSALAREIADNLQKQDAARRARFDIAPEIKARADPRLMRAALENLIGNAWKFTAGREEARIAVGAVERDGAPMYFVEDNGAGFDMAYAGKLFGAFQRLHDAAEYPGTGIGLATVQRIIHKHGGRLWAEAAVDRGATFYFTIEEH